jgi:hypothetical protein
MIDKYLVKTDSLQNVEKDGFIIGFKFQVRIGGYRGCFLSLHNGYYINVDGVEYPRELQKFEINGKPPRGFDEIAGCVWEHWDYDTLATVYVQKANGLAEGAHTVGVKQGVLTQYGWQPHDEEWIDNPPDPREMGIRQTPVSYHVMQLQ